MEKRVRFRSTWLPWALLAPQLAVIGIFFFWPAAQALLQSVQIQDAFGATREFVGLENFRRLFADETYIDSFKTTAIFSVLVAGFGISIALVLAVFADRVLRGAAVYKTLLVWPYAVAPGGGRRAVAIHVCAVDRHRALRTAPDRLRMESSTEC